MTMLFSVVSFSSSPGGRRWSESALLPRACSTPRRVLAVLATVFDVDALWTHHLQFHPMRNLFVCISFLVTTQTGCARQNTIHGAEQIFHRQRGGIHGFYFTIYSNRHWFCGANGDRF